MVVVMNVPTLFHLLRQAWFLRRRKFVLNQYRMSKNQFFVPYYGNKYREAALSIEKGMKGVDWSKVQYVIEPFCGSAGFSRYIHYNIPNFKGKFIWADADED